MNTLQMTVPQKNSKRLILSDDTAIRVEGLHKKFCRTLKRSMFYGSVDLLKNLAGISYDQGELRKDEFWALENINFELKKEETLGIIGVNGAGKSTLLRLLSGIFPPDKGRIVVNGKIGSLIAVGAGFHPHMTGRENIYLNGTILGINKKEIREKFKSIVEFADIGDFLDAPVSTYSSGMRVRLGFAIAIHSHAENLLIDEILSVGDLSFQNKSLRKMSEFRKQAYSTIFVSHNLEHIRNLCTRLIVMDRGSIAYDGAVTDGIVMYQELSRNLRMAPIQKEQNYIIGKIDNDKVLFLNSGILNSDGKVADSVRTDESFTHFVDFELLEDQQELMFSSGILDEKNNIVIWVVSNDDNQNRYTNIKKGKYRMKAQYEQHHLMPGVYSLSSGIRNTVTYETFQRITYSGTFKISSDKLIERGIINTKHLWSVEKLA